MLLLSIKVEVLHIGILMTMISQMMRLLVCVPLRASASAFLICDGDTKSKPRTAKLKEQLGARLHILPYKEMENILPHNVTVSTAKLIFESMQEKTKTGFSFYSVQRKRPAYFLAKKGLVSC